MASVPIKPLDGEDGYLRWKESVLLLLNTADVAHVLTDDPPAGTGDDGSPANAATAAAAKKWVRDDAVCRGHILAALSDRLLPDYVRHATGRALWDAVARTYDVAWNPVVYEPMYQRFLLFQFEKGSPLLEQLAHAEALAATKSPPLSDAEVAGSMCRKLPEDVANAVRECSENGGMTMDRVWKIARITEEIRIHGPVQYQVDKKPYAIASHSRKLAPPSDLH
ncbi:hypothetical protein EJB05_49041, partial [Eragrostis curvula]